MMLAGEERIVMVDWLPLLAGTPPPPLKQRAGLSPRKAAFMGFCGSSPTPLCFFLESQSFRELLSAPT